MHVGTIDIVVEGDVFIMAFLIFMAIFMAPASHFTARYGRSVNSVYERAEISRLFHYDE